MKLGQEAEPAADRRAFKADEAMTNGPPVHAGGFFCNIRHYV
jgi:hypothetical protein